MTQPTWVQLPSQTDFPVENLPYGVATHGERPAHVVTRIGDYVVSLGALAMGGLLDGTVEEPAKYFAIGTLNPFMALGAPAWAAVRARLTELFTAPEHRKAVEPFLVPLTDVVLYLPFQVADYVDFYSSEDHATNLGRIFRPDAEALLPNWKPLPIGYHGRAGTVVPSGTPIVRPSGQRKSPTDEEPRFGPSVRLDIEAEVGFVVGAGSTYRTPVPLTDLRQHVFGVALVNDWSARDVQAWEYVPLGPFLGKSFATSISGWITPLAALDAAWVAPPARDVPLLPYLDDAGADGGLDLRLEVRLNGTLVSRPPFAAMYWTPAQMLAHMTVNGAHVRPGDLFASGTVSGPERDQRGCLLELTDNGARPVELADGSSRGFLADGDEVVISATAPAVGGGVLRLGDVRGRVAS